MRGFVGWLHTTGRLDDEWIAAALSDWLVGGGDLPSIMGLRPQAGNTNTPPELVRQEECDRLLVRLSLAVGGHKRASRILRGLEPAPVTLADTVIRLRELNAPTSVRAFNRARKATRAHLGRVAL